MCSHPLVPQEKISDFILLIRGKRVILDIDLARLYGVSTRRLNEQVRRNCERFPPDFMFEVTCEEKIELVAFCDRFKNMKHSTVLPRAFTEHGAIMVASILNSPRAVAASIYVVRAFVRLRELLAAHQELAQKLDDLERKIQTHDKAIQSIFAAIRQLMTPPETPRRKIGFVVERGAK